jgi:hypothetical protein
VGRIISVRVVPIKGVVDDDNRPVVIVQRTPSDIVISRIPMYPGWTPVSGGYPIPAKSHSPVPASVMGNTPSPGFIRNPSPSTDRIPRPPSIIIRSPGVMIDIRNPDITIGAFVNPLAVIGQLRLIIIKF